MKYLYCIETQIKFNTKLKETTLVLTITSVALNQLISVHDYHYHVQSQKP